MTPRPPSKPSTRRRARSIAEGGLRQALKVLRACGSNEDLRAAGLAVYCIAKAARGREEGTPQA